MCWQCVARPEDYLGAVFREEFSLIGWYDVGDGVCQFTLCGEEWHTNPEADIQWMSSCALPGDVDGEGNPLFLPGRYNPAPPDRKTYFL